MRTPSKFRYDRPRPRAGILLVFLCVDLLLLIMLAGIASMGPIYVDARHAFPNVFDATSIRIRFGLDSDSPQVSITEPAQITRLRSLLRFSPKSPCLCLHDDFIFFESPAETTWADLCDHCFDYHANGVVTRYGMHPDFLQEYVSYAPIEQRTARLEHWPSLRDRATIVDAIRSSRENQLE